MAITPLPSPPQPTDTTAQFNSKAFAWVAALGTFVTETNATEAAVDADAAIATAKAAEASASAAIATTKASEASTSATAAASAKTAAESARDATLAAFDSFDDRYLGAKTADPTVDNDGNPLAAGSLYFNTISGVMKVYTGSAWVAAYVSPDGLLPLAGGTMTGAITFAAGQMFPGTGNVTTTGEQTLTNKTLTDPRISLGGTTGAVGQVLTSAGSGSVPTWTTLPAGSDVVRVARTSNTTLANGNKGNLIAITSGTFTQTFNACSSLGNGWYCYLQNAGTGDITLDPNGSETIDGLTSFVMYPGEVRLIQCDGSALRSIVLNSFYRTFTESGTFIKPPGYATFAGLLWGAGGGGGKSGNSSLLSGGGGGGACHPFELPSSVVNSNEIVTIGAGGAGATVSDLAASTGGNSAFSIISAFGGGGGYGSSSVDAKGGSGGGIFGAGNPGTSGGSGFIQGGAPVFLTSSVSNLTQLGFFGGAGFNSGSSLQNPGGVYGGGSGGGGGQTASGSCVYSGAGGAGAPSTNDVDNAGTSLYGGAGGSARSTISGVNGSAPGGGGGATRTGTAGGSGARGELRIWGVI